MNGLVERRVFSGNINEIDEQLAAERIIERFTQCWNHHDAGCFSALFEEKGDFVSITGHHAMGRSSIQAEFLALPSMTTRVLMNRRIETRLLARGVAVAVTHWCLEKNDARANRGGSTMCQGSGIYILVKRGDQWRIRTARMAGVATAFKSTLACA